MNMNISTSFPGLMLVLASVSTGAVSLAWIMTFIFRRTSAAFRHFIWLIAFSAPLLALPMAWWHPRIVLPIALTSMEQPAMPPITSKDETTLSPLPVPSPTGQKSASDTLPQSNVHHARSNKFTLSLNLWRAIWLSGTTFLIGRMLLWQTRFKCLVEKGSLPASGGLILRLNATRQLLKSTRRVRLMISPQTEIPFCHGIFRPTIILPISCQEWDQKRIDVCLTHEMAHIVRGDLFVMLVGQLTCILCWFNPLVWLASIKLRDEAENAVDDLVLCRNIPPEIYASALVGIAERYHASDITLSIALPMARANRLKARVNAILDSTRYRKSPGLGIRLAISLSAMGGLTAAMSVQLTAATAALNPAQTFKDFVVKRQAALSSLRTFKMEGSLKITCSEEYLKEHNSGEALKLRKVQHSDAPGKESLTNFRIWGKGGKIKEIEEHLDAIGKVKSTDTYYLDSKQLVWVQGTDQKQAKTFTLGEPQNGLYNCPAFFEYSFLRTISVGTNGGAYGVRALLPTDLATNELWNKAIQGIHDSTEKDGIIHTTIMSGRDGSCSLDLIPASSPNNGYQIGSISFFIRSKFLHRQTLNRKIEVLDFVQDPNLGEIGKAFRMELFGISKETGPGVVWAFAIKDIELNSPIDDKSIAFGSGGIDPFHSNVDTGQMPMPGHLKKATQILEELRALDDATDQWANINHKKKGDHASPADLLAYVKKGTPLYAALEDSSDPKDLMGNAFGPFIVDKIPEVNRATFKALSDAASYNFWSPFIGK